MFSISISPPDIVVVRASGMFDQAELARLDEAMQVALAKIGRVHGGHRMLIDNRDAPAQTQEIAALFKNMLYDSPRPALATAVVAGGSISRLQTRRVIDRGDVRLFDEQDEALGWLRNYAVLR